MESEKLTWVTKPKGKRYYVVRWVDPKTHRTRQRATGLARRRDAQVIADQVAGEVFSGRAERDVSWHQFSDRYILERLGDKSPKTAAKWRTASRLLVKHIKPTCPRDVSADKLSRMIGKLMKQGMKSGTLASHLRHIRAGLSFAVDVGLLAAVPNMASPGKRRRKHMRGRPITGEEFDRILLAASKHPEILAAEYVESWKHLLNGLWYSGLRLGEALDLGWDDESPIQVHKINGRRPMLLIPAEHEKGGQDRIHPMTPDFVEFLRSVPNERRTGPVFRPVLVRGPVRTMQTVSKKLCDIGKAANVVVEQDRSTGKVKYASAHDLRRSFGARWSTKVMPAVLQQLMRHESVETTMKYYVGQNAEQFADVVWDASVAGERGISCGR